MKKLIAILALAACLAPAAFARDIDPVVSAAWLEANLANPNLVIMDVRAVDAYKAGHIPGAVNVIGASLYVKKGDTLNEVPEMDDLSDTLSSAGVKADSWVVVVEADGSRLAWSTRVTWTLKYAGLENVAFLDGGYAAWTKAAKPVSKDVATKSGSYTAKANPAVFADKARVLASTGAQIVDARTYDAYFGLTRQAFVAQAGHFPGAYSLPYTWILNADGSVKAKADLASYAEKIGLDPARQTIVYCDSGVLATAWWYAFSEILGWKNVSSFDGSSQVLTADPSVKYVPLVWR